MVKKKNFLLNETHIFIYFFPQDKLLDELNSVSNPFPKIQAIEFIVGWEYPILEIIYMKTYYNDKAVLARILDVQKQPRTYFLPPVHSTIFTRNFEKAEDINCNDLYLVLKGFLDVEKRQSPILEFRYMGDGQHDK